MKTLIGGAAAAILGIILLVVWWKEFLMLLAGAIPFALLSGGALAVYLGFDELRDTWKTKKDDDFSPSVDKQEIDKYKKEVDDLKKEVEDLKKEKK